MQIVNQPNKRTITVPTISYDPLYNVLTRSQNIGSSVVGPSPINRPLNVVNKAPIQFAQFNPSVVRINTPVTERINQIPNLLTRASYIKPI